MSVRTRWLIVVPVSLALGFIFSHLHVPAAWIVAAIVASAAMALSTGKELEVNHHFYALARGFIGIMAAIPLTLVPAHQLLGFLPAAIAMSLVTLLIGLGGGILLHRAQPKDISWETGILSMLPGGASLMPALASELGADYRYVALSQYLRLLVVSITLPLVVVFMAKPEADTPSQLLHGESTWWIIALTIVVALGGDYLGRLVRLPAPAVLGPLILTPIVAYFLPAGHSLEPHDVFKVMAFLSIGWVCGGGMSLPALKAFARQLPATLAFIAIIIGVCALTAWPLTHWLGITYFEAYLATTPGALETVLALSAEGGAGAAVVAVQIVRLLFVLVVAAYLPQILRLLRRGR